MDLETRLRLLSFPKPAATPLVKATGLAFVIHVVIAIYVNHTQEQSVAELPDWVNIKLVAGIDENKSKKTNQKTTITKKHEKKREDNDVAIKNRQTHQEKVKKNEQLKKQEEKKSLSKSATTMIKANSRPYLHENPKPVYPAVARRRGMQGVVLLNVEVNANGRVTRIKILQSSGFRILDVAAIQSVEQWKFIPGSKGGINAASIVKIPIRFSLQETNNDY